MSYTNQRVAYGNTLVELGRENPDIVVLDADLCGSTMGKLFEEAYPERHFEMGIAEANMTSVAADWHRRERFHLPIPLPSFPEEEPLIRFDRPLPSAG